MDSIREQIYAAFAAKIGASRALKAELVLYEADTETIRLDESEYDMIQSVLPARVEYERQLTESEMDTYPQILNNQIATIILSAVTGDRTLGGLCDDIVEFESEAELRDSGSRIIGCKILFQIPYSYNRGDPFSNSNKP